MHVLEIVLPQLKKYGLNKVVLAIGYLVGIIVVYCRWIKMGFASHILHEEWNSR